jgi:uncharacterized protein
LARIILLLIIVFALYLLFRGFFRSKVKDEAKPPQAASVKGEDMVACARCGVNLPRSEAREEAGRLVCQNNPHCHS